MSRPEPVLYADHLGGWFLLSGTPGFQNVDAIAQYIRLGTLNALMRLIADWLDAAMPRVRRRPQGHGHLPVQQVIADGMGVKQNTVSTWILGTSQPSLYELEPDGIRWLIQAARCAINWRDAT